MNTDHLWEAELDRRVEEIRQGVAASEPAEIVMKRLRQKPS